MKTTMTGKACAWAVALLAVGCADLGAQSADQDLTQPAQGECPHDIYEAHEGFADNDALSRAFTLAGVSDDDGRRTNYGHVPEVRSSPLWISTSLTPDDVDWYSFEARDLTARALTPTFVIDPLPGASRIESFELCMFVETSDALECELGTPAQTDHPAGGTLHGCCAEVIEGFEEIDGVSLGASMDIDDQWLGILKPSDDATVYVRVQPGPELGDGCHSYRMWWHGLSFL